MRLPQRHLDRAEVGRRRAEPALLDPPCEPVADGAAKLTTTVRDNDVDQILSMAQDFGRKQPAAFMGAAALLGFAASRFLLASASRRSDRQVSAAGSGHRSEAPSYTQSAGGEDAGI